jgi:UDP-N-acetylmuramoyl-tripeptide--D-alanyl-D-alanine ligase
MLELGAFSRRAHEDLGEAAARAGIDLIVAVGSEAAALRDGAVAAGMPASAVRLFDDSGAAAAAGIVRHGDTVLVKGSHGLHMERVVEALASEFAEAGR